MGPYTQLTQEQRYQIHAFMKAGFTQKNIAREIGVHPATISREIKRNRGQRGYRPIQVPMGILNPFLGRLTFSKFMNKLAD